MNGNPPTGTPIEIDRPGPGRHVTTIEADGRLVETLADLPPLRDRLLFVGLNPSPVSVEAGHYHQGRLGRAFWGRLMQATILPADTDLGAADDALVAAGHGITDLHKLPSPRDDASDAVLRAGGFTDARIQPLPTMLRYASIEECWEIQHEMASPLRNLLRNAPPDLFERVRARLFDVMAPYVVDGEVRILATPLVATGSRLA